MIEYEKLDRETVEGLRRAERVKNLLEGDDWALAVRLLNDRIEAIRHVSTLPFGSSPEEVGLEAMYRMHAIEFVNAWLDELNGIVDQYHEQIAALNNTEQRDIINRYSSST